MNPATVTVEKGYEKLFQYPIAAGELLRQKKKILKSLKKKGPFLPKKIAVLAGSTVNAVVEQLELFLLYHGIAPTFYQSEYGQYWQDAMFPPDALLEFSPDIIYIHTTWRNLAYFPSMSDTKEEMERRTQEEFERFSMMWDSLKEKFHCPIIQNNFERPDYRILGNRDIWDERGRSNFISKFNQLLYGYAQAHYNFYVNDIAYLASDYGLTKWNDPLYWNMYRYAMDLGAVPFLAQSVANIIKAIYGKNKKVLALDLDNTLWGGVVGDGVEQLQLGVETPSGRFYMDFQRYCKQLKEAGVLLTVNSKNDLKDALSGLSCPDSLLKPEDFASIKANWEAKDCNLRTMAEELSLGTDAFVFVDDNPAERSLISGNLPEVSVVDEDSVETFIMALDHSGFFEPAAISAEDLRKTELYRARAEALRTVERYPTYGAYLDSLQMEAIVTDFEPAYVQRISQLTNKSNQFNLTTLRCSEADIRQMQDSDCDICLCGRLIDRFGDNGIVSVVAGNICERELHIRLWVMSCRVLKRGMEDLMMNVLLRRAEAIGLEAVTGYYIPTSKNAMVKTFFGSMGFHKTEETEDGTTVWKLKVREYQPKALHIREKST